MPTEKAPVSIDDELRSFLESGVAVVVGTRNCDRVPEITRGWGTRVSSDGSYLELCLGLATAQRTLENLRDNGQMAVTFARPTDYRAVQLKGHCIQIAEPGPHDIQWVERHLEAFAKQVEQVGVPRELSANFWSLDLVRIRFSPEEAFDQTPGPDAGLKL